MNRCLKSFYYSRLVKYSNYGLQTHEVKITFNFHSNNFLEVRKCYGLDSYIQRHSFADMQRIMHIVFDALSSSTGKKMFIPRDGLSSISLCRTIQESNDRIPCWGYALTLTECFLSIGIPARMIRAHSGLPFDHECHCVCVAYCPDLKKDVLFDVANNVIYYSEKCVPLDLNEFRERIINDKRIIVIQKKTGEKDGLIAYWLKNLVVFQCFEEERFGNGINNNGNRIVYLIPERLNLNRNVLLKTNCKRVIVTRNNGEFWNHQYNCLS